MIYNCLLFIFRFVFFSIVSRDETFVDNSASRNPCHRSRAACTPARKLEYLSTTDVTISTTDRDNSKSRYYRQAGRRGPSAVSRFLLQMARRLADVFNPPSSGARAERDAAPTRRVADELPTLRNT